MNTIAIAPVLTAEPRAMVEFLKSDVSHYSRIETDKQRITSLIKAVLPDVINTPTRLKRINNALFDLLKTGPRPWREVESIRDEFVEVFDAYTERLQRVLSVAIELRFSSEEIGQLPAAEAEVVRLYEQIFSHWPAFTEADLAIAKQELDRGEFCDLNEVIRELQGRA